MSKAWWIGGLTALWAWGALLGACNSNPCDDLATICDQCTDVTYKNACKNVVARNTRSLCNESRAVYTSSCPAPPPSSSASSTVTVGSGGGSSSAASSASGGGAASSATGTGGAGGK